MAARDGPGGGAAVEWFEVACVERTPAGTYKSYTPTRKWTEKARSDAQNPHVTGSVVTKACIAYLRIHVSDKRDPALIKSQYGRAPRAERTSTRTLVICHAKGYLYFWAAAVANERCGEA